jgi:hypothetical protein
MQVDQSLYLDSSNVNKEGQETQYQLGNTCSRKTTDRIKNTLAEQHFKQLQNLFSDATKNGWLLVLVLVLYQNPHK